MAVDYLSALNVGSGLNVTQIVDAIVDAERVPRETFLNDKIEEKTVSISSLGEVKSDVKTFDNNLDLLAGNTGLAVASTDDKMIAIEDNGKIAVQPFSHKMEVSQLAASHTVSFQGFTSASQVLASDTLAFDFGTWATNPSPPPAQTFTARTGNITTNISLTPPTNTLADLASAINDEDMGVTANIIRLADNNYAMTLVSKTGENNQMRITATGDVARVDYYAAGTGAGTLGDALGAAVTGDKFKFSNGTSDIEVTLPAGVTAGSYTLADLAAALEAAAPTNSYMFEIISGELKVTDETAGANAESWSLHHGPGGVFGAALTFGVASGSNVAGVDNQRDANLNFDPENYAADASYQVISGQDAEFTLDGVDISRDTNEIEDLLSGVSLTLNKVTTGPVTVSADYNASNALTALELFVAELNFLIQKFKDVTFRGTAGEDNAGPLAGDPLIKSYLNTLKSMTTKPIPGFQADDIFMSNFGVMTERDGTLSINELTFNAFFEANPDAFSAMMNTRAVTDSNLVQAEITGTLWQAGNYNFNINPDTTADLDGDAMSLEGGKYKITTGDARGLALTLLGNGEDTTVRIGKSLLDILKDFSNDLLVSNNQIDTKISSYNDDITDYNDKLKDLSERMDGERKRYTEQFASMESSVTSFKKTGELLDNFMESWKAGLNN